MSSYRKASQINHILPGQLMNNSQALVSTAK